MGLNPYISLYLAISYLVGGDWNMTFILPYIGNNHPTRLSYFSEGLKPPTRYNDESNSISSNMFLYDFVVTSRWPNRCC